MDRPTDDSTLSIKKLKKHTRADEIRCCLCKIFINANVKKRYLKTPSIFAAFKVFAGDWEQYDKDGLLCQKCHGKALYAQKRREEATVAVPQESEEPPLAVCEEPASAEPEEPASAESEEPVSAESEEPAYEEPPSTAYEEPMSEESEEPVGIDLGQENSIQMDQSSCGTSCSIYASEDSQSSSASTIYHLNHMHTVPSTQSSCFICRSVTGRGLIPKAAVKQVWDKLQILVPVTNRCCKFHLNREQRLYPEDLQKIVASKVGIDISSSEFGKWLMSISMSAEKTIQPHRYSFEDGGIEEESYKMLTSLTKPQFDELYQTYLAGYVRNSANRSARDSLGMLLMILRKNLTQDIVAFMFGTSQPVVSTSIKSAIEGLLGTFVPKFLGVDPANHITREEALQNHSVDFFTKVFEKPTSALPLILDATYLYIEKPGDFAAQSKTFSAHKKRNLIKVMLIVCADGYILDAVGPYYANGASNDATILKHLLAGTDLKYFTDEGDFYLMDRGFRDAIEDVRGHDIDVYMPSLLKKDQKQFTVEQAADSRKVTACRWIVEAMNGRLKNVFKFFAAVIEGGYNPTTVMDFCKIACALLNKFRPPLLRNQEKHNRLANRILEKSKKQNELKKELDEKEITSRFPSQWNKISTLPPFPQLSMDEMITLACGIYQVRLGQRYIEQNSDEDGNLVLLMHKEEENLYRVKISSRFQSNSSHQVFLKLNPAKQGVDFIEGYVCDCKVGLRVVGSCSHTSAVIRYLCYNQFHDSPTRKRKWDGVMDAREEVNKLLSQ